jgi:hypothetical protein
MKMFLTAFAVFFSVSAFASELYLYTDMAEYLTVIPAGGFVGFTESAKVYCAGNEAAPEKGTQYPADCWLCGLMSAMDSLDEKTGRYSAEADTYTLLLDRIDKISDPAKLYDGKLETYVGSLYAKLLKAKTELTEAARERALKQELFKKGSQVYDPLFVKESCPNTKLLLRGVSADYENMLTLTGDTAKAELVLKAVNRSGVDIRADTAYLLPGSLGEGIWLPEFQPWYVRVYEPYRSEKASRLASAPAAETALFKTEAAAAGAVSREAPSVFKISGLNLPSSGNAVRKTLDAKTVKTESRLAVYPYTSDKVFRETSFEVPFEVYGNIWKVVRGRETFENVASRIYEGRTVLAAGCDRDIVVKRKELEIKREKDGFFGGKKRMKRGYIVELSNLSAGEKTVYVIERVPVSADDRVTVENVLINAKPAAIEKEGLLDIEAKLSGGASVKYEITFEIVADKDLNVGF